MSTIMAVEATAVDRVTVWAVAKVVHTITVACSAPNRITWSRINFELRLYSDQSLWLLPSTESSIYFPKLVLFSCPFNLIVPSFLLQLFRSISTSPSSTFTETFNFEKEPSKTLLLVFHLFELIIFTEKFSDYIFVKTWPILSATFKLLFWLFNKSTTLRRFFNGFYRWTNKTIKNDLSNIRKDEFALDFTETFVYATICWRWWTVPSTRACTAKHEP